MVKRKTIEIDFLIDTANDMLKNSADEMVDERKGIAFFLETALLKIGRYKGYNYLTPEMMIDTPVHATSFGVIHGRDDKGNLTTELHDLTRRYYQK